MSTTTPYFAVIAVLFIVLTLGIVGQCELREKEKEAEYLSRMETSAFDREQNVDMADRILAARVEREWREKQ